MPIKMIANRALYRGDDLKEYKKGETFMVADEKDADRLVRTRRASRAEEKAAPPPKPEPVAAPRRGRPPLSTKVMTPEPVAPAPEPGHAPEPAPEVQSTSGRYFRSDMRSED